MALNVAVSPAPGTGVVLQFVPVAQLPFVTPVQVALAAKALLLARRPSASRL